MPADPLLPLSPRQAAALGAATTRAVAAWRSTSGSGRLPRIPEQVLVALVGVLRTEDEADRSAGHARARTLLRSGFTGAFGAPGLIPTEVVGIVEQARAGVAAGLSHDADRTDEALAADLLIAWGFLEDADLAERVAAGTSDASLLDELVVRGGRLLREKIPEKWTPWAVLKLLWELRQLPGLRERFSARGLRSRGLRAIPILGALPAAFGARREMVTFQRRLDAHLRGVDL
jgi:hypothetical protein